MPNINKGRLKLGEVIVRQAGNDWPTAQVTYTSDVLEVSSNLYFTNTRAIQALTIGTVPGSIAVTGNLSANGLIIRNISVSDSVLSGNVVTTGGLTGNTIVIDVITANIWNRLYTANVVETAGNLYFTNTRAIEALTIGTVSGSIAVTGNLIANGLIIRNISVSDSALTGSTSANSVIADSVTSNVWNRLYTANVVETAENLYFTNSRVVSAISAGNSIIIEANGRISANVTTIALNTSQVTEVSSNVYFTNTRARGAFTAGRGIIIMSDGTIKSTVGTETFNTAIDGGRSYSITTSMNGITFVSNNAADRLILRSLHVTNVSDNTAYVSSNVLYAGGNTAYLANLIPVPVGGIVEFMDRVQLIQPNDTINLQAFDQNQTPANGVLQAYFTYETVISDTTYVGTGHALATSNANILLVTADQSDTLFESIKFVNLKSYPIPIKTFFGDANVLPKAYLAYNLQIPPNSSVEILQSPKLLKYLDSLYVSYTNASDGDAIAVFPSYRRSAVTTLFSTTPFAVAQGGIRAAFTTTVPDGSTLYYTLE